MTKTNPHANCEHSQSDDELQSNCNSTGENKVRTDGGETGGTTPSDRERYADSCVKHRCGLCHQIFDAAIHGANCPDCGGAAFCTFTEEGCT